MDTFLWWSGIVAWGALVIVGSCYLSDWIIDRVARTFGLQREFMQWAYDRRFPKSRS